MNPIPVLGKSLHPANRWFSSGEKLAHQRPYWSSFRESLSSTVRQTKVGWNVHRSRRHLSHDDDEFIPQIFSSWSRSAFSIIALIVKSTFENEKSSSVYASGNGKRRFWDHETSWQVLGPQILVFMFFSSEHLFKIVCLSLHCIFAKFIIVHAYFNRIPLTALPN